MKITKRQLKRIIREEYSRLQRRGLIREMYAPEGQDTTMPVQDQMAMIDAMLANPGEISDAFLSTLAQSHSLSQFDAKMRGKPEWEEFKVYFTVDQMEQAWTEMDMMRTLGYIKQQSDGGTWYGYVLGQKADF